MRTLQNLGTLNPKPEGSVHATWKSVARPALGTCCGSGFGVQDWNLGSEGSKGKVREGRISEKKNRNGVYNRNLSSSHILIRLT